MREEIKNVYEAVTLYSEEENTEENGITKSSYEQAINEEFLKLNKQMKKAVEESGEDSGEETTKRCLL